MGGMGVLTTQGVGSLWGIIGEAKKFHRSDQREDMAFQREDVQHKARDEGGGGAKFWGTEAKDAKGNSGGVKGFAKKKDIAGGEKKNTRLKGGGGGGENDNIFYAPRCTISSGVERAGNKRRGAF